MDKDKVIDILRKNYTFPDMFGFYFPRNRETREREMRIIQDSDKKKDKIKYVQFNRTDDPPVVKEDYNSIDLLVNQMSNWDCNNEYELFEWAAFQHDMRLKNQEKEY